MSAIQLQNLRKVFDKGGQATVALDDISFSVGDSEFVSVVGPSGCGKTTLLNIVSGLEPSTSGTILVGDGSGVGGVGYVFQEPRLLPWRRVIDNIMYVQPDSGDAARQRALRYLAMVGLENSERMWPAQLSGGMQQRVGIARALSVDPALLLMDEPFSHLDAITARSLRRQLQEVCLQTGVTVLFVTHDIGEAVQLSDRIIVLERGGRVQEIVPVDLSRPRLASDPRLAALQAEVIGRFEDTSLQADEAAGQHG